MCVCMYERERESDREGGGERERDTAMGKESNSKIRNESGDVTTN